MANLSNCEKKIGEIRAKYSIFLCFPNECWTVKQPCEGTVKSHVQEPRF